MAEKILVVDDEEQIRNFLADFLTGEGYEVITASSGEEGIDLAQTENPKAILLDFKMPGIDGVETCKKLRIQKGTRFIPVIMITAFSDNKIDAIKAGIDDFVNKPFDPVELLARVRSITRMRYLANELERLATYIEELEKNLPKS